MSTAGEGCEVLSVNEPPKQSRPTLGSDCKSRVQSFPWGEAPSRSGCPQARDSTHAAIGAPRNARHCDRNGVQTVMNICCAAVVAYVLLMGAPAWTESFKGPLPERVVLFMNATARPTFGSTVDPRYRGSEGLRRLRRGFMPAQRPVCAG